MCLLCPAIQGLIKKKKNLGTWESILFSDYKLLCICWSALCSGHFFFLTCSTAQITKQRDKKIFWNLCLLCCKLSSHMEHKSQGLKYEPELCCFAFSLSILSMCLFNHCWNGVFIAKRDCVCMHVCVYVCVYVSGGGTKIIRSNILCY